MVLPKLRVSQPNELCSTSTVKNFLKNAILLKKHFRKHNFKQKIVFSNLNYCTAYDLSKHLQGKKWVNKSYE